MAIYRGLRPALITHVSTGAKVHYCYRRHCGFAKTPVGDFKVYRKIGRWRTGPLGAMYRPLYFHGGTAMHGSTQVPNRPASHGCIRIPMHNATLVYKLVKKGTRVHIR